MSDREIAIWNRALTWPPPEFERPGDRALQAILIVDGQIMNGGLESAVEYRSPEEVRRAADGFAYFGQAEVAALLREALAIAFPDGGEPYPDDRERILGELPEPGHERLEALGDEYHERVDHVKLLDRVLRERLASHPEDFAPIG